MIAQKPKKQNDTKAIKSALKRENALLRTTLNDYQKRTRVHHYIFYQNACMWKASKLMQKVGPLLNYKLKNIVSESICADLNMQDEDIINFIHFFMLTKRKHTIQPPI